MSDELIVRPAQDLARTEASPFLDLARLTDEQAEQALQGVVRASNLLLGIRRAAVAHLGSADISIFGDKIHLASSGAMRIAGILAAVGIGALSQRKEIKEDTAMGVIFAGAFALQAALLAWTGLVGGLDYGGTSRRRRYAGLALIVAALAVAQVGFVLVELTQTKPRRP
jgi:hypothetical protein